MNMNGQLFKDLDALTERIGYLSLSDESLVERMLQQLMKERPGIGGRSDLSARDIARLYLDAITAIPSIVRLLKLLLEKEDCKPEWRHEIVLALVYLVRSDDLVPDDTPGGYGFIDDYIVLRIALSIALSDPDLTEWIVSSLSRDKKERAKLKKEYEEWRLGSSEYIGYFGFNIPAEKGNQFVRLIEDVSATYKMCSAWAAVSPESLEHRTGQLIDDPRLSGPVLTHPVDDDALWRQWEYKQAEKRKEAMWKAEEERSLAMQKLRLAETCDRYMRDRLRSPTMSLALPGGGTIGTDGHGVYITKPVG